MSVSDQSMIDCLITLYLKDITKKVLHEKETIKLLALVLVCSILSAMKSRSMCQAKLHTWENRKLKF